MKKILTIILLCLFPILFTFNSYSFKKGGVLKVIFEQEPDSLNPVLSKNESSYQLYPLIFDGLFRIDNSLNYNPNLLMYPPSISNYGIKFINNEKMIVTLKLRDKIQWHDGYELTSEDIKFTWQVFKTIENRYKKEYEKIEKIELIDKLTAIVYFNEIYPDYKLLFNTILPKHCFSSNLNNFNKNIFYNNKPIGTGPFKLKSWVKGKSIILEANPNYHLGKPYLDQIQIVFKDYNKNILDYISNADIIHNVPITVYPSITDNRFIKFYSIPSYTLEHIAFNLKNKLLSNIWLRKAIAYAINKKELTDSLFYSLVYPAYTDYHPYDYFYNPNLEKSYPYNIDKAISLLNKQGYKLNTNTLIFNLYTTSQNKMRERVSWFIKESLKKIGIELNIHFVSYEELFQNILPNGKFDLALYSLELPYTPDRSTFWHSFEVPPFGINYTNFKDYQVDKLLEQAKYIFDIEKRKTIYQQISLILTDFLPIIPLFYIPTTDIYTVKLQNFKPNPINGIFWNACEFWLN